MTTPHPPNPPATPLGDLAAHLPEFAARLRRHQFVLGAGEITDALRALRAVQVLERREVKDALRAVLTSRPEQGPVFDAEFEAYFGANALPPPPLPPPLPQAQASPPPKSSATKPGKQQAQRHAHAAQPGAEAQTAPLTTAPEQASQPRAGRAAQTLLSRLSPQAGEAGAPSAGGDDLPELLRAAGRLLQAVQLGHTRRRVPRPRGAVLDLRRTLQAARRTAGDPVGLRWLGQPRRAPRFLIVLDGSRSMGHDAERLLRFAFALHLRSRRVEVYAFSTELRRLTPLLRQARPGPGMALHLPQQGQAWGGGTRIGENLLRLTREQHAHISQDTAIFILSDGLDTGDPALVSRALRDLRRRAGLLVWLSPLAGQPHYRPVQRAMQAALPHLHALLPAASTADLLGLGQALRRTLRQGAQTPGAVAHHADNHSG